MKMDFSEIEPNDDYKIAHYGQPGFFWHVTRIGGEERQAVAILQSLQENCKSNISPNTVLVSTKPE